MGGAVNEGAGSTGMPVPPDLVEMGFLRGAYGLQGWVHVQPHSGEAEVLRGSHQWWLLRPGAEAVCASAAGPLGVTGVRVQGAGLVAKWRGCDDPEAAQALKGWRIAVSRSDFPRLPPGQYYWVDLVGAVVVNREEVQLGVVRGLRSNGVHDLLEVEPTADGAGGEPQGKALLLIPMVAAYIDSVDLGAGRIRVDWDAQW